MRKSLFILALCLAACSSKPAAPEPKSEAPSAEAPPLTPKDDRPVLLCFGNSLTAGYGVAPGGSYPDLLQKELDAKGYRYRVVNAGISGDTTSGGVSRLTQAIALKPAIVLLELGGNDGLRGMPLEITQSNLEEMIAAFQKSGATVLLAGMTLPRNYGPEYINRFEQVYRDLARTYKITLVPFLLEPMIAKPGLIQPDGLHPTAEGYRLFVPALFKYLAPVLDKTN